jgi:predicted amidohydrolase
MLIATVQFAPTFKDKAGNLKRLAKLVLEAARKGARIVVLPELCTTGYSFMSDAEARPFAECPRWLDDTMNPSMAMSVFYKLASNLNVHIIFGYVELDPGTDKLFNSQLCISPDGSYDGYQKLNFFSSDWLWASKGSTNPPVIDIEGKRVGLLVCKDVRDKVNDKWTDLYSPGDADLVCLSANWGKGGFPSGSWMDFVEDNKTSLVVSNRYGVEGCNDFGLGGICIIDKSGKVNCDGLVWGEDCIVYGEV